ncbi:phage tail tape measure protein [Vibrio alginolyticus]|nr:phage tail tape measure protein [Vibrio alginolyticus]
MSRKMYSFTNTIRWKLDRQTWNDVKKQSQQLNKQLAKLDPLNSASAVKQRKEQQDAHIKHYRKLQAEQRKFSQTQKTVLRRFVQSTSAVRDLSAVEKKVLLTKLKQASTTEELLHLEKKLKNQVSDTNRKEKQRTRELAKQAALITKQNNARRMAAAQSLKRAGVGAGLAAGGLATVGMQQSLQKATDLDQAIKKSGLDAKIFQDIAAASAKFGLSMDQVASNYQDFADRLGEFRLTGSGEFKDIAEWLQQNSKITTKMLESLEPLEVMHLIQKEAERRGTDMRDLTFLMESFSSEAINQFKAMQRLEETKALRERYNLNLQQSEIDTLVQARRNIGLIGDGFGRLMDQFLVGFGSGDIDKTMQGLRDLQPTFRSLGESVRSFVDTTVEHGNTLITIAKVLGSVWVGSKIFTVMSGGLTVVKTLTNSFKGLFKLISRAASALGIGSATSASVKGGTKAAARAGGAGARLAGRARAAAGLASRANPWLMGGYAVYEARKGGLLDPENFFGKNKYTDFLNTDIFDLLGRMGKQISSIQTQHQNPQKVDVNLHVRSDVDASGNIIPVVRGEIDQAEDDRMVAFYSNLSPSN